MFRNYLTIVLRTIARNPVFSLINIVGLGIGLACCLLILLYAKDELTFDRFQKNNARLYRVTRHIIDKKHGRDMTMGISGMVQGPAFEHAIPGIQSYVRTNDYSFTLRRGKEVFRQTATWVDDNFFTVFSFPLLAGNPAKVLSEPYSIVLTDEMAKKYFGTSDAVAKTLELEIDGKFQTFTVTGIAKRSPENSSIQFDMLLPFAQFERLHPNAGWLYGSYSTYLLLEPGASPQGVSARMQEVYWAASAEQRAQLAKRGFEISTVWGLQPFSKMHLDTSILDAGISNRSDPAYSYILIGIAAFILIIACINFINLTIAQSLKRSKEIGLRKVVGGSRSQLIRQFLGESFIVCACAFILALTLASLALPLFNEMANKRLSLSYLVDGPLTAAFLGLYLATGFIAGFYPALVLSRFKPVETLYHRVTRLRGRNYLAKGLVVLQFALATFLIIATMFFYSQYDYLSHTDLGYNDKNLLTVSVSSDTDSLALQNAFKTEVSRIPGVRSVAKTLNGTWGTLARAEGHDIDVRFMHVDEDYLSAMGISLSAGRNFSRDFPADSARSALINQAFAEAAGWKHPIGKIIDRLNGDDRKLYVVGVVKDYHFATLKEKIGPEVFITGPRDPYGAYAIRLDPANTPRTLAAIEAVYRRFYPWHLFEHSFVEDDNFKYYEQEARWRRIITSSAVITVFISCIGLFGLSLLSIRQRTKEIGVRKVLGAGVWRVSALVARNFIALVLLSFGIAIPVAWVVVGRWLDNFPYRVSLNGWVFVGAAATTLVIAALTISFQAIKAARANPVDSLRAE
ncbi:MAG TPA: ABC transporter permease [Puia sp.]|uniref:ABC transporter permease n=1 Tax=Puia sp. TaxID=2045100 RepID=UPI002C3B38F7|nr:ABC transporter permease [Puia sp.]HVU99354.1 ABC transporter permease [Puia sp.]